MNLEEFFEWLGKECINQDGTQYFRPEFLWNNKAHNYYEDMVMCMPVLKREVDWVPGDQFHVGTRIIRVYWDIQFMLSPYANRDEYPKLLTNKRIALHETEREWKGVYAMDELKSFPVEFWFRETENSLSRVKITPFGKPGADIPYIRKFLIEYDR